MKQDLRHLLGEHPVLQGMEERHLAFLAGCARNERLAAGEVFIREGSDANASYLIRRGLVSLEVHVPGRGTKRLHTIAAGEIVGWSWMFPPYRWHFDAVALEPTLAFALDGTCLRKKCEADHDLGFDLAKRFLQEVQRRLERTRLQILDLYGKE